MLSEYVLRIFSEVRAEQLAAGNAASVAAIDEAIAAMSRPQQPVAPLSAPVSSEEEVEEEEEEEEEETSGWRGCASESWFRCH